MTEEVRTVAPGNYGDVAFNTHVVLQPSDSPACGKDYVVPKPAAALSGLVKDLMEDQTGNEETRIPVPSVNSHTLGYVVKYMQHHADHPAKPIEKPLRGSIKDHISQWDRDYLFTELIENGDETKHALFLDVMRAANFLNVKDLLDLTCACLASMVMYKSVEEIRTLFNITNDFTPEEEARLKKENECFEPK
eukprot:TRINITY_DN57409_c0_g1_i1.p1 TRINITY_DN57409_c0_g1~~TRINITY_DN57409_c0_g1_i1.p1  ORF type:complete len:202 (+),score=15.78 TRINITY_DN57409_c0_g1_i1:33-608(+)